ncbi:hypothetical protein [Leptolinea tardivitalis]|uniref:Uncharacterized protein n=1 Tax=Leptolinea tardivitalis TaxID=229920 RepID=A0A0P6WLF7_9CHLR|nr:hypothetical protein [Leptolinea tardivitalis]KPL70628.1 hypothetical protein ADM99_16130 [Leptolinea tardivitalis]GAP22249.1 hypothetical protein LTAR_02474 [Leptolinea tardivitalis]
MKPVKIAAMSAIEKSGGVFRLKPAGEGEHRQEESDMTVLAKGGLKADELAGIVARLMERVSALEKGG